MAKTLADWDLYSSKIGLLCREPMSPLHIYCSRKIVSMPGFFPSIHAEAAASRLKVPATIKANFQTPHIELQGEAPSCALTKSKRKIKSVAALLFLFLKPYFIITFFFAFRVFMVVLPACFFTGKPSSSPFPLLSDGPWDGWCCLKKSTLFYDYFVPSKAQATLLKSNGVVAITGESEKPVGRIYIFKEGRNERKKDDHNDDVCILAKPTAYNSFFFFFISFYRTVEYFCLVECRRVV